MAQSSGRVNDVPPGMIKDLDHGKAYLQIISGPDDKAVFKGNVRLLCALVLVSKLCCLLVTHNYLHTYRQRYVQNWTYINTVHCIHYR